MADETIHDTINRLVDEEHALRSTGKPVDAARLTHVEEQLDQCWDLLRQRQARREFNLDEGSASARDVGTVEGYEQ